MNLADTGFVIIASVLVWFMTPGLAFFYGGLVSKRNVINTMLSVFYITGIAILLWVAVGYELSFNGNLFGVIGQVQHLFLSGVSLGTATAARIPTGVYILFQMMFAIITPALFVGAVVGRMHFKFLTWFIVLWSLLVYYPRVHLIWSPDGLLAGLGVLDFAGGTVIHINAGITALTLSAFLGRRADEHTVPYNRPWVLLGTAILWIGWYGFNAGSALGVNQAAMTAALTTSVGAAAALVTWMILDIWQTGHPTLIGTCTGALCGLVGITPATGYVTSFGAVCIGVASTLASYWFISKIKPRLGIDDTLDAFGCHGVSGIVGSVLTGVFASKTVAPSIAHAGLAYGGGWHLLLIQLAGTIIVIALVAAMVTIITSILTQFVAIRVSPAAEKMGLDYSEHAEPVDEEVAASWEQHTPVSSFPDEFKGQLHGFDPRPHQNDQ